MFGINKKTKQDLSAIYAPVSGSVYELATSPDSAFASGALGKGVIFRYDGNVIMSPCAGTVTAVAKTGHSVVVTAASGAEVLLHVGTNTVALNGKGFNTLVSESEPVRIGEKLIKIDRGFMKKNGVDVSLHMTVVNTDEVDATVEAQTGSVTALQSIVMRAKEIVGQHNSSK